MALFRALHHLQLSPHFKDAFLGYIWIFFYSESPRKTYNKKKSGLEEM